MNTTRTTRRLLYIGRIAHNKGVHNLIKAFPRIHAAQPEAMLMIRGQVSTGHLGDYHEKIQTAVKRAGLDGIIQYTPGWICEEEKVKLIKEADAVVFPSVYSEGFGIGPVEALKLNGIVVTSDLFVETGAVTKEVAFVYQRNSVRELARSVLDAISLPGEERLVRKKKAREFTLQFSWERHVEALEAVLHEALGDSRIAQYSVNIPKIGLT